jgi:hypothetical protein
VSSYKPLESDEKEGDETTDGRDVAAKRSLERIHRRSRREKLIAIFTISITSGIVGFLAFGSLVSESEFAEVVARELRGIGIDAGQLLQDVERFLADLDLLQLADVTHELFVSVVLGVF